MQTGAEHKVVSELGLADSGKLLVMFCGAEKVDANIQEDFLDSYVYLLSAERVLDFKYSFRFAPLPYSPLLRSDVEALIQGEFLSRGTRIFLAPSGKEWIQEEASVATDFQETLKSIGKCLKRYTVWSRSQLFQAIYGTL